MKKIVLIVLSLLIINFIFATNFIKAGFKDSEIKTFKEAVEKAKSGDIIILDNKIFDEKDTIIINKDLIIKNEDKSKKSPTIKGLLKTGKVKLIFQNINFIFDKKDHGIVLEDTKAKFINTNILSKARTAVTIKNSDPEIIVEFENFNLEGDDDFRTDGINFTNCGILKVTNGNFQEFDNSIIMNKINNFMNIYLTNVQIAFNNTGINIDSPNEITCKYTGLILKNLNFVENIKYDIKSTKVEGKNILSLATFYIMGVTYSKENK